MQSAGDAIVTLQHLGDLRDFRYPTFDAQAAYERIQAAVRALKQRGYVSACPSR
jgi:hypothetical protein